MKKMNILKSSRDFDRIIKTITPFKTRYFLVFKENKDSGVYNFGFSVGKKLGSAPVRNKIKRQLKNILDEKNYKNNFNCIIMVRKPLLDLTFSEIRKELFYVLSNLNITEEK